jgi:hypothetical protein
MAESNNVWESRWLFTPHEPWTAGDYRLVVDTAPENLVGNGIARAFDIVVFEQVHDPIASSTMALPESRACAYCLLYLG